MINLPPSVQKVLEGRIDPKSQHLLEQFSQTFLIILTIISFISSYFSSSVILGLELFLGGLVILLLAAVPPWPYLNRYPRKFLPVRKLHQT
ncbi:hypothetical protein L486_06470 [Kwoniella mangroviensis CBS 10435]|uniref:Signal peptidase complex subunit 1 n=1 Tax=Kwoniella mangroviensis CBS 10435 TaxID=1331196 RepID=A0A1B9IJ67_9TREE|nr:uncharacterized protein I203_05167 [Kwoniella mangroviensis CBS 8507]OCF55719.1 hypothetical protein L486_06470 [Kwoniella mangroviensis CBS 10435]OCF65492.1 hypothetical protein I203_05167 [Kwoniella mangroviensis CBS 8507]